jgi:hypothetical protein
MALRSKAMKYHISFISSPSPDKVIAEGIFDHKQILDLRNTLSRGISFGLKE